LSTAFIGLKNEPFKAHEQFEILTVPARQVFVQITLELMKYV